MELNFFESWMILTVDITENIEFHFWCMILTVDLKKYQILLRTTRIFYDYLRTRISGPKSPYFKIDKFSLVL